MLNEGERGRVERAEEQVPFRRGVEVRGSGPVDPSGWTVWVGRPAAPSRRTSFEGSPARSELALRWSPPISRNPGPPLPREGRRGLPGLAAAGRAVARHGPRRDDPGRRRLRLGAEPRLLPRGAGRPGAHPGPDLSLRGRAARALPGRDGRGAQMYHAGRQGPEARRTYGAAVAGRDAAAADSGGVGGQAEVGRALDGPSARDARGAGAPSGPRLQRVPAGTTRCRT